MKVSLPTHVPMRSLMQVVGVMLLIQLVEGTTFIVGLEFAAFLVIAAHAFNAVGGLVYPSGAYIFFLTVLSDGLGGVTKMLLGEPLQSNLLNGERSMLVYLAGMCAVWCAAQIAARVRARRPWLTKFQLDSRARQTALGAAIFGQFGGILIPLAYVSTFNQVNNFLPLAILVIAYTRAKETGGAKSFTVLGFLIWLHVTIGWGLLAFSKQGMFLPSAVWAIGALVAGYRVSLKKLVILGVLVAAATSILTPVSQIGRNTRFDANSNEIAWDLVSHPIRTRNQYLEYQRNEHRAALSYHWYSDAQGLLDRLAMMPVDDALIHVTDQGHVAGAVPIITRLENGIPRYLLSGEKPTLHWGNVFGHEIGLLGKHDDITGISFTPISDAYHCLKFWGMPVFFLLALVMFAFCDSLTGSTEQTIWATLYISLFTHSAPEGMLGAPVSAVTTYAFGVTLAAFMARWILPYIGGFLLPTRRTIPVAPLPAPFSRRSDGGPIPLPSTIESSI